MSISCLTKREIAKICDDPCEADLSFIRSLSAGERAYAIASLLQCTCPDTVAEPTIAEKRKPMVALGCIDRRLLENVCERAAAGEDLSWIADLPARERDVAIARLIRCCGCSAPEPCADRAAKLEDVAYQETTRVCDYDACISHPDFDQFDGEVISGDNHSLWFGYERDGVEEMALISGSASDITMASNYSRFFRILHSRINAAAPEATVSTTYDAATETFCASIVGSATKYTRLLASSEWTGTVTPPATPERVVDFIESNCVSTPVPGAPIVNYERWEIVDCAVSETPRYEWRRQDGAVITQAELDALGDPAAPYAP